MFVDIRIDRNTVPEGKYQYEIAGDDESGGEPARVQNGVWDILRKWDVPFLLSIVEEAFTAIYFIYDRKQALCLMAWGFCA